MRTIRSTFLVALVLAASLFTGCAAMEDDLPEATSAEEIQEPVQAPEPGVAEVTSDAPQVAPARFCRSHLDCFGGGSTSHFCCNNRCVRPIPGLICVHRDGEGASE